MICRCKDPLDPCPACTRRIADAEHEREYGRHLTEFDVFTATHGEAAAYAHGYRAANTGDDT